ncbi:MAG: DUF4886 domain-containing protein [Clostridia bacterium]|nr:DUF4886 domain-containing protein [Clostridia bacterium]
MLKILSIGNSFSEDAHRHLYKAACASGVEIFNENLYIGGCPLSRHYENLQSDAEAYDLHCKGLGNLGKISIDRALKSNDWDIVTLQQVSHLSVDFSTYEPYLTALASHIREVLPNTKIAIHQTWSYRPDSEKLASFGIYETHGEMFDDIRKAYARAVEAVNADLILPSGETLEALKNMGYNVHRDDFHANRLGDYAAAITWIKMLFGEDTLPKDSASIDFELSEKELSDIDKAARASVEKYR